MLEPDLAGRWLFFGGVGGCAIAVLHQFERLVTGAALECQRACTRGLTRSYWECLALLLSPSDTQSAKPDMSPVAQEAQDVGIGGRDAVERN